MASTAFGQGIDWPERVTAIFFAIIFSNAVVGVVVTAVGNDL